MKIFNKICTSALFAAALLTGACSDDEREPSPVVDPNCAQVYFDNANIEGKVELEPNDPTQLTIRVERAKTDGEITVPIRVLTNTDNVFTGIPESVTFAAGSSSTSFTVRFDETELVKEYTIDLRLTGPHADPYAILNGTIGYSATIQRIKWVNVVRGAMTYTFLWGGTKPHTIERGEGTDMYRIKDWGAANNGAGVNITFNSTNDKGTKFTVPEQLTGFQQSPYGDVMISGTIEFDEAYTYTFKLDYHVSEGSFGTAREKFIVDHQVDPSEFKATISVDPGVNDANVAVEPANSTIAYFTDMAPKENIGSASDSQLTEALRQNFLNIAEEQDMTLEQVVAILAKTGAYRYTAEDLEPNTTYIAYAYAIDMKTAKGLSAVTRYEFKTQEAGEPSAEYLNYVGTWTVTSEESVNGGPMTFEVTLSQRVPNSSFYMTGWTNIEAYKADKVSVKYKNSSNSLLFTNFQDMGVLGTSEESGEDVIRYFIGYMPYEAEGAPVMPVGGEYNAMEATPQGDGNSLTLTGESGKLDSGGEFTIVGLEYFGRDNSYVYFLPWGQENPTINYALGPYTIVKSTATPASAKIAPMQHRRIEMPVMMSFSSVKHLKTSNKYMAR